MKRLLTILISLAALCGVMTPVANAGPFFQLPMVPDTMKFENRVNYLVEHYWDFCDLKKAFSSRSRMAVAFKEYLDLMPLADDQVALKSVEAFIKKVDKPDNLLFITRTAEDYMHSDTAVVISDYLYLPFARAVADNRKIDRTDKMRYERQARVIANSMAGAVMPDFEYVDRAGGRRQFAADTADVVLLYIFDTDCSDCAMARVRLYADVNVTKLLDAGRMKVVAISPTSPDGQWRDLVGDYPEPWIVGAKDDLDDVIEFETTPTFYLLDNNHRVYGKNINLDAVLEICRRMALNTPDPYLRKIYKQQREQQQKTEN